MFAKLLEVAELANDYVYYIYHSKDNSDMLPVIVVLQAIALFLTATIVFDILHLLLHLCLKSRHPWLHKIGNIHLPHHRFFNINLKINHAHDYLNLFSHVLFENCTQLAVIISGLVLVHPAAVILAALFQIILFLVVLNRRGEDPHHQSVENLPAYKGGWFVTAPYHALHHHYSANYYSSYFKLIDVIFGTAHHLAGKKIVMTGASGALGSNMKRLLENEGAIVTSFKFGQDYDYNNYEELIPALSEADILFLCHGSKFHQAQQANCDSYIALIELYKNVHQIGILPPEVWATGSEIECHPTFGIAKIKVYAESKRHYAKAARQYYHDSSIQYRHLVHSAFISPMGPGLMTASFAAYLTLFLLKRGFRYVPVSYTGFGFLNYFRFLLRT